MSVGIIWRKSVARKATKVVVNCLENLIILIILTEFVGLAQVFVRRKLHLFNTIENVAPG